MSEWIIFVKAYATKHNISYKQALRDAPYSYKTRNEKKPEETTDKTKRKYNKNGFRNFKTLFDINKLIIITYSKVINF